MRHHHRRILRLAALVITVFACVPNWAADRSWMRDAPAGHMTKEDWAIANDTRDRALENGVKGHVYRWQNPQTGAKGAVTPLSESFARKESATCRRAKFDLSAAGQKNTSTWTVCKVADGWKLVQ